MSLFGNHSSDPYGAPANYQALEELYQRAQSGDAAARKTLQTIAAGGTTHGNEVPGWNEDLHWGPQSGNSDPSNSSLRQAAGYLLSGNTQGYEQLAQLGNQNYKPWSGGALADIAPMAVGALLAPITGGASLAGAAALGAATGGLESATGLTNRSVGSGMLQGGLEGAAGEQIGQALGGAGLGAGGTSGVGGEGGSSFLDGAPAAIGKFITKNPAVAASMLSTGANIYGQAQQGAREDSMLNLQEQQAEKGLAPKTPFRTWQQNRQTALPGG